MFSASFASYRCNVLSKVLSPPGEKIRRGSAGNPDHFKTRASIGLNSLAAGSRPRSIFLGLAVNLIVLGHLQQAALNQ